VRIYTRSGDDGYTYCSALGRRIPKDSELMEFLGTLDEANSALGLARSMVPERLKELDDILAEMQKLLFEVGFSFAGSEVRVSEEHVGWLESIADKFFERIELKGFILPSGPSISATIHLARTIVRRAERRLIGIKRRGEVEVAPVVIKVLNRMSDALFALAVWTQLEVQGSLEYA